MEHPARHILAGAATLVFLLGGLSHAQVVESRNLTGKISGGTGTINILNDIRGADLSKYFDQTGKMLLLGVDVNESADGNESRNSLGVAIKQAQLSIQTTSGEFTFREFFTGTSAQLRETGQAATSTYSTLFGKGGSGQIKGGGAFDLSNFDDVMWFNNINFTGDILGANLQVQFLDTGGKNGKTKATESEQFFDFSGGFEDFALLKTADAILLDKANNGMADSPAGVTYSKGGTVTEQIESNTGGAGGGGSVPAAPTPPIAILAVFAGLVAWLQSRRRFAEI